MEANIGHIRAVFGDCLNSEVGDILAEIQVELGHRTRFSDRRDADVADISLTEANGVQIRAVVSECLRAGVCLGGVGLFTLITNFQTMLVCMSA